MGARADYALREGFFLDANTKLETTAKDVGLDLGTIKTIRVVVLDATVVQGVGGTDAKIEFKDADESNEVFYTITATDLAGVDQNGVYLDHVRGKLWEGRRNVFYAYEAGEGGEPSASITGFSVYLDAVENVA